MGIAALWVAVVAIVLAYERFFPESHETTFSAYEAAQRDRPQLGASVRQAQQNGPRRDSSLSGCEQHLTRVGAGARDTGRVEGVRHTR